jgi:hypothetical protein
MEGEEEMREEVKESSRQSLLGAVPHASSTLSADDSASCAPRVTTLNPKPCTALNQSLAFRNSSECSAKSFATQLKGGVREEERGVGRRGGMRLWRRGCGGGLYPKKFFFRYLSALTNMSAACGGSVAHSAARRE